MSYQHKVIILKLILSIALTSAINLKAFAQQSVNDTLQTYAVVY